MPFEVNACYHLVDQDLEGALKALEGEEQVDPREMAVVKFSPSAENPNAQYADEIYYPPVDDPKMAVRDIILPQDAVDSKYFSYLCKSVCVCVCVEVYSGLAFKLKESSSNNVLSIFLVAIFNTEIGRQKGINRNYYHKQCQQKCGGIENL